MHVHFLKIIIVNGSGTVLVIDGNMKNHRSVCAASDAGYIEYDGLPGRVKTGCTNTPEQNTSFVHCTSHVLYILASSQAKQQLLNPILEKRETRSATHYKVIHYL